MLEPSMMFFEFDRLF